MCRQFVDTLCFAEEFDPVENRETAIDREETVCTIAIEGSTVRLVTNHFEIFHSKTPGITVANDIGAVRPANHLTAQTAIEVVNALDLPVGRLLEHSHFGAFIRIITRLRGTILTICARLTDLMTLWMWLRIKRRVICISQNMIGI